MFRTNKINTRAKALMLFDNVNVINQGRGSGSGFNEFVDSESGSKGQVNKGKKTLSCTFSAIFITLRYKIVCILWLNFDYKHLEQKVVFNTSVVDPDLYRYWICIQ
jgi:hypothetical protein